VTRDVDASGRRTSEKPRLATITAGIGVFVGVAHLYGPTEQQLVRIFETFHENWDNADRLAATLKHFHAWGRKLK